MKNTGRALEIESKHSTAAVSKNPKAAQSTISDVINFYYTGKGLSLGVLVQIFRTKLSTTKLNPSAPLERFTNVED